EAIPVNCPSCGLLNQSTANTCVYCKTLLQEPSPRLGGTMKDDPVDSPFEGGTGVYPRDTLRSPGVAAPLEGALLEEFPTGEETQNKVIDLSEAKSIAAAAKNRRIVGNSSPRSQDPDWRVQLNLKLDRLREGNDAAPSQSAENLL